MLNCAHNQKFHLGIYGIIIENQKILLIKKSRGPYIGRLDLPGGKPEFGETPFETVKREILEETGIVLVEAHLRAAVSTVAQDTGNRTFENIHHIGILYTISKWDKNEIIKSMNCEDSLGADWYALSSLTREMLSPFAWLAINPAFK
jgi:8-oxo-dGTP diphosphatase